jgi:hypothetical protein
MPEPEPAGDLAPPLVASEVISRKGAATALPTAANLVAGIW